MTGYGKRALAGVLCVSALLMLVPGISAQSLPDVLVPAVTADGTLVQADAESIEKLMVMDARTGMVVACKDEGASFVPSGGAVTLMTAYLALSAEQEHVAAPEDFVQAYELNAGLEAGCAYRVEDLVSAMLMTGAQDCAAVLAEQLAGSQEVFVQQMNETAALLGMKDTAYVNCTGAVDVRQKTTAQDLARLAHAVYGLGRTEVFSRQTLRLEAVNGAQSESAELTNRAALLLPEHESYDARIAAGFGSGGSEAGANTVLLADTGDMQLLIVAMTQRSERRLYEEVTTVLDALEGRYVRHDLSDAAEKDLAAQLSLLEGVNAEWETIEAVVTTARDVSPDTSKLRCEVRQDDVQVAPGQVMTQAQVFYDGILLDTAEVVIRVVEQESVSAKQPASETEPAPTPAPKRVETVLPEDYEPYQRSVYDRFGWVFWSAAAVLGGLALWLAPGLFERKRR